MSECPYCHTTYQEIIQTGFVGCEHCYQTISQLQQAVQSLYGKNRYGGKKAGGHGNI